MRGVECGPDRRPVPRDALYRLDDRRAWFFQYGGIEFVVGGGPRGPRPDRFEVAERVAGRIEAFGIEADEYLATFIVPDRFEAHRPWQVESFEFGIRPSDPADEFEVLLVLEGDPFGFWGVRFRSGGPQMDRFYPIEFRRRQR